MQAGLDVLNVGAGHLKFNFSKDSVDEVEKAKKVITDMLRRGYMLFAIVDGEQKRIRKFDPELEEYILEEPEIIPSEAEPADKVRNPRRGKRGKRGGYRGVPMRSTRATGIAPTAGG